ncbi:MAG: hypothetical protein AVDCRST_MAG68-2018, partial [uncultured Gemmatimonadetes bacterium]
WSRPPARTAATWRPPDGSPPPWGGPCGCAAPRRPARPAEGRRRSRPGPGALRCGAGSRGGSRRGVGRCGKIRPRPAAGERASLCLC